MTNCYIIIINDKKELFDFLLDMLGLKHDVS